MSEVIRLLVVIVNYKATDLTAECLKSISLQIGDVEGVRVAVCENGTGEEDAEKIQNVIDKNQWGDWCRLTAVMPNRGFSGGNNVILEAAEALNNPPENYLLINADTVVREHALKELMLAADMNPDAGIISPRLEWPDGTPQISCFNFINPISEFIDSAHTGYLTKILNRFDVPIDVIDEPSWPPWTTFACALIRREVVRQVGFLDPGYFLYFDDPDFCRRARMCGWRVLNWPKSRVVHLRGQSNPVKSLTIERKQRPSYFYASRARYFAKFYSTPGLWLANMLWLSGRLISLCREVFGAKSPHVCEGQAADIWKNALHPMKLKRTGEGG